MSQNTFLVNGYKDGSSFASGDQVQFRVRKGDPEDVNVLESSAIVFQVPNWPDLVTSMTATYNITQSVEYDFGRNREFRINRYQRYNIDNNFQRLTLVLASAPTTIAIGDKVLITASPANALNPINGNNYQRIRPLNRRPNITVGTNNIDLRIPTGLSIPNSATGLSLTSSIREYESKITYFNYSFRIGNKFYENFINRSNVKDILIFAYTKVPDVPNVAETKYLLKNDTNIEISESTPPGYSEVSYMVGKSGSDAKFQAGANSVVDVYVSIARYTKINEIWSGQWLQKNSSNSVIWKKLDRIGV